MHLSFNIRKITYAQLFAFNDVLGLCKKLSKNNLNNSLLCCFYCILALHLKLERKTMFVQPTKHTTIKITREQAHVILAFKQYLSENNIGVNAYSAVVFMDITQQLDKQIQ